MALAHLPPHIYTMSMRKIILLIIFSVFIFPAHAQTLRDKVARNAQKAEQVQARKTQIKKALQWEVFNCPWNTQWDAFLIENSILQVPEGPEDEEKLCTELFDTDCELFTDLVLGRQQWQQARPDYARETKNIKYIYVAESSDHETKSIPREMERLLKQIRQANPQARILLALEFAVREDAHAIPIHFAHETNRPFTVAAPYAHVAKTADKLDMDMVALDDFIPGLRRKDSFKLGNSIVTGYDHPDAQRVLEQYQPGLTQQIKEYEQEETKLDGEIAKVRKILLALEKRPQDVRASQTMTSGHIAAAKKQFQKDLTVLQEHHRKLKKQSDQLHRYRELYLHDFLSRTPWGMEQRNDQWARYIQALSPFYDIIITYAGSAHLSLPLTGAVLLPKRIGKPFVLFDFYTQEQLKQEDAQAYEQLYQIQEQENPDSGWWEEMEEDEMTEYCRQYYGKLLEQPINLSRPFFIRKVYSSAAEAAGQDPQRRSVLRKYNASLEFAVPHTDFSVLLPDYSKRCLLFRK